MSAAKERMHVVVVAQLRFVDALETIAKLKREKRGGGSNLGEEYSKNYFHIGYVLLSYKPSMSYIM